ncbi:hypothetical protein OBBRIDRAFT_735191 [Obba rivulosa]|uniref:Uncharacterized protein n=1 Tax=Obba rivulosa TaxID=1052685 RepID=A0A8E2AWP3_9APHY|nr:hypothetical protein OBBRIDRAFT_735191 [Obba rivulosa]
MTAAYAFTDYCSQGQTIPYVLIDITIPPPSGTLSLFSLYVALLQSSGSPSLMIEDDRLKAFKSAMLAWWKKMEHA